MGFLKKIIAKRKANSMKQAHLRRLAEEAEYREGLRQAPIVGRERAKVRASVLIKEAKIGKPKGTGFKEILGNLAGNFNANTGMGMGQRTAQARKVYVRARPKSKKRVKRIVRRVKREIPGDANAPISINYDRIFN